MVQVEAIAAGLPVVSTRLGTGVELVNHDDVTGRIVPPDDAEALSEALRAITSDEPLRDRLGRAALARSDDFGPGPLGDRYAAMYREAI